MTTRVVHCKHEPFDVMIDRDSIFGNPITHITDRWTRAHRTVATRQESLTEYEKYLRYRLKEDEKFREEFLALKGKTLGCWCKPKACHGDIILKVLNELDMSKWF